jgi:hypothetical protein
MRYCIAVLYLLCSPLLVAQSTNEEGAISEMLVAAYVEGIYVNRDREAVLKGFHPDFVLHVYDGGNLIQAPLEMWLGRLQLDGTRNPDSIDYEIDLIDITGNSAIAKMRIFENSQLLYTDYFGLYKFEDGWKIVNKIFHGHN